LSQNLAGTIKLAFEPEFSQNLAGAKLIS